MMRIRMLWAFCLLAAMTLTVQAQEQGTDKPAADKNTGKNPDNPDHKSGGQADAQGEEQPHAGQAGGMGANSSMTFMGMVGERLSREMQLTPEQQRQLGEIVEKHRNNADSVAESRELSQRMMQLTQKMEEARQRNDEPAVNALRQELSDLSNKRILSMQTTREGFFADVESILTPEQKTQFKELRSQYGGPTMARMRVSPRILQQSVNRMQLGPEQRTKIAALFDHFRNEMRGDNRGNGGKSRTDSIERLTEAVMKELTEEQRTELKKMIEKAGPMRIHEPNHKKQAQPDKAG